MFTIKEINKAINGKIIYNNLKDVHNFSINSKDIKDNCLFIAIKGKNKDGNEFTLEAIDNGAIALIIDSNYEDKQIIINKCNDKNISLIEVDDTLNSLHLLASYNRRKNSNTKLIAITGSNGKTSVKELLYDVLKNDYNVLKTEGNLNNHIGLPLTLLKLNNHDICILEMGMNHLGEIEKLSNIAKPDIAVITNIGTAHIGNLGSRENILKAKMEITSGLAENGMLFLNNEDELLNDVPLNNNYTIFRYGFNGDVKLIKNNKYIKIGKNKIKLSKVGGLYPINIALAYKISDLFNIPFKTFKTSILKHKSPNMRMEIIKIKNNIVIIDCYNANYDSMKNGIDYTIKKYGKKYQVLLYLGDMLELGEWSSYYHKNIGDHINDLDNVDVLYVTGEEIKNTYNSVDNDKIIKKEFKTNSNIDNITDEIINDMDRCSRNVIYFKASRGMKLDNIANELVIKLINRS